MTSEDSKSIKALSENNNYDDHDCNNHGYILFRCSYYC